MGLAEVKELLTRRTLSGLFKLKREGVMAVVPRARKVSFKQLDSGRGESTKKSARCSDLSASGVIFEEWFVWVRKGVRLRPLV